MEFENGVVYMDGASDSEVNALKEKMKEIAGPLIDEQRARLNGESPYPWWASAVFALRDINGICNLLTSHDMDNVSGFLKEVVAVAVESLAMEFTHGDREKVAELMIKLSADGAKLDAILEQALRKSNGEGEH